MQGQPTWSSQLADLVFPFPIFFILSLVFKLTYKKFCVGQFVVGVGLFHCVRVLPDNYLCNFDLYYFFGVSLILFYDFELVYYFFSCTCLLFVVLVQLSGSAIVCIFLFVFGLAILSIGALS